MAHETGLGEESLFDLRNDAITSPQLDDLRPGTVWTDPLHKIPHLRVAVDADLRRYVLSEDDQYLVIIACTGISTLQQTTSIASSNDQPQCSRVGCAFMLNGRQGAHADTAPWRAKGRVMSGDGTPLPGVTVRAATGFGTLNGGSSTLTDANGRYDLCRHEAVGNLQRWT